MISSRTESGAHTQSQKNVQIQKKWTTSASRDNASVACTANGERMISSPVGKSGKSVTAAEVTYTIIRRMVRGEEGRRSRHPRARTRTNLGLPPPRALATAAA